MKTIEIETILMKELNVRQNIVVPNVSWGFSGLHECDLLKLSKSGYATEIEIKISKADLLKDKNKLHKHKNNLIKFLFFAVPEKLKEIALKEISERAGLYVIKKDGNVEKVKKAMANLNAIKFTTKQRLHLAHLGCMRIITLKNKILKLQKGK